MGVCLSKGGHGPQHENMFTNDDDGFCTPEGVSSQYESPNPSGRYSFAHFETPRVSADVGDFGALGSLFYRRGSRSREIGATTTAGNFISPLDMFLGGVSGRNRVHHVNQICAGDYSFASYLASPLLKGFDVHAMEAVAKSYAESAAKAAARDTFVFLEENDVSVSSLQSGGGGSPRKVSTSFVAAAAAADDCGDVDDDLAKSGESEEWEEPTKSDNWDEAVNSSFSKSPAFRASDERGTNDRWVSVLNAVQARAKARRRQRRKSSTGKGQGTKERGGSGGRKKTVRFRLAGVQEGFTDDDIRSGKESEYDQALESMDMDETDLHCDSGEATTPAQQPDSMGDDGDESLERTDTRAAVSEAVSSETAAAEEECDYLLWQDIEEDEERGDGGGDGDFYGEDEMMDSEFAGFTATEVRDGLRATASEVFDGLRVASSGEGPTPFVGDHQAGGALELVHVQHPSLESFSSSEYILPETRFGSSQEQEEDLTDLPLGDEDYDEEAMSPGNDGLLLDEGKVGEGHLIGGGAQHADEEDDGRQCCPADADYTTFDECAGASSFPHVQSHGNGNIQQDGTSSLSFMKDISVTDDTAAPPPAIPVGCVVVESRMPDGSRMNPQVLDVSEVHLPERGENNYGIFHARILCSGDSSPSGSDPNSDHEGSFSFPVLLPSSIPSPQSSSSPFRETRGGLWRDPPLADLETPIKNRSIRPHSPPHPPPPCSSTTSPVREIHEVVSPTYTLSEDNTSCDPRSSFSFDIEQTETKRTHEIILPTPPSRSLSSSPVFSPSKAAISSLRAAAAAASPPPLLPAVQVSSFPYPPRARRSFNKKLKFYSLERASYAAASAKRFKSPPSFSRQSRERRRDADGESDSDLFEIETMSGTNAMGSSRTPPSTPTKSTSKMPPAAASFDFEKLSDSIARVSRSRSKRNCNNTPMKTVPLAPYRDTKARCLPVERKRDSVFQEGGGATTAKSISQNSLKGRALLKLAFLMRSKHCNQQHARSNHSRDSDLYRSSETSVSEYLENRPPSPAARHPPHGRRGHCIMEDERTANNNYAFEWYCSSMGQRVAPLHHEKRQPQQQSFSSHHRSFSNEDRTFAVKN